ncbi:MAG: hypothetical protein J7K72_01110 [Candidatus Aenigmarchaeota archaeon]|nr:hypothetical protein [Candidatus Aenigmarchaeota archaeon]
MEKIIKSEIIYNEVLKKEELDGELFKIRRVIWRYATLPKTEIRVIIKRSYPKGGGDG